MNSRKQTFSRYQRWCNKNVMVDYLAAVIRASPAIPVHNNGHDKTVRSIIRRFTVILFEGRGVGGRKPLYRSLELTPVSRTHNRCHMNSPRKSSNARYTFTRYTGKHLLHPVHDFFTKSG